MDARAKGVWGQLGHSFDLMALDSNAQVDLNGDSLPHFTPWSSGVNLFAQTLRDERLDMRNPFVPPIFCLIEFKILLLLLTTIQDQFGGQF